MTNVKLNYYCQIAIFANIKLCAKKSVLACLKYYLQTIRLQIIYIYIYIYIYRIWHACSWINMCNLFWNTLLIIATFVVLLYAPIKYPNCLYIVYCYIYYRLFIVYLVFFLRLFSINL